MSPRSRRMPEARLVDPLRDNGRVVVSLVARIDGAIVGHVLFSPVTIERAGKVVAHGLGLAPLAVVRAHQGAGIGSALVRAGLAACRALAASPGAGALGASPGAGALGASPGAGALGASPGAGALGAS